MEKTIPSPSSARKRLREPEKNWSIFNQLKMGFGYLWVGITLFQIIIGGLPP